MSKVSILTDEEIFGKRKFLGKEQLDIFKKIGLTSEMTDFSTLLGSNGRLNDNSNGAWWINCVCKNNNFFDFSSNYLSTAVNPNGKKIFIDPSSTHIGVRPTLPFSFICSSTSNKLENNNDIMEIEFGEYPQNIVPYELGVCLENEFKINSLQLTGKYYTTISPNNDSEQIKTSNHDEYYYNEKKYIRVVYNSSSINKILPDGREIEVNCPYWVEVKPIKWFVDIKSNIAISEKVLFSGVCFDNKNNGKINFKNSFLKHYIDEYFSKNIIPSMVNVENISYSNVENKETIEVDKNKYSYCNQKQEFVENTFEYEQNFSSNKKSR